MKRIARAQRGFTILELTLALVIGSTVVVTCFGLMAMIDRAGRTQGARMERRAQLYATQLVVERAMQRLVMNWDDRPDEFDYGNEETFNPELLADGGVSFTGKAARFVLERDEQHMGQMMSLPARGAMAMAGDIETFEPQRLEVALREAPVAVLDGGWLVENGLVELRSGEEASQGQRMIGVEGMEEEGETEDADVGASRLVSAEAVFNGLIGGDAAEQEGEGGARFEVEPGVRGVFELTYEGPEDGWTLWWRVLEPLLPIGRAENGELIWPGDRVALLERLRGARWEVYRDRVSGIEEMAAVWKEELPAYVELEVQTLEGMEQKWMFEIGWLDGQMPGRVRLVRTEGEEEEDGGGADAERAQEVLRDVGAGGAGAGTGGQGGTR